MKRGLGPWTGLPSAYERGGARKVGVRCFSPGQVKAIREAGAAGATPKQLSQKYLASRQSIGDVMRGRTYQDVK